MSFQSFSLQTKKPSRFQRGSNVTTTTSSTTSAVVSSSSSSGGGLSTEKRSTQGKDYFDDDDDEQVPPIHSSKAATAAVLEEEIDPLDSFMAGIEQQAQADRINIGQLPHSQLPEIVSQQYEDNYEDLVSNRKPIGKSSVSQAGDVVGDDSEGEVEVMKDQFDEDGKPLRKAKIEPLPPFDHSKVQYPPVKKAFYKESLSLQQVSPEEYFNYEDALEVQLSTSNANIVKSRAIMTFEQAGFDQKLLKEIQRQGLTKPTPIQAQALPLIMSGCDVLALAKTGSGKTYAYLWPLIVHIMHQPQMQLGDGPIGLILAPTRELVIQITQKLKSFSKLFNIRQVAIYGGSGKYQMQCALQQETPEIVIATPGRLIEMIRCKATNLQRCTMLILDEADCMFDIGFEYQIRSVIQHIRPDKQCLMFSATMKKKIENFARDVFQYKEIRIQIGNMKEGHEDIQQCVAVTYSEDDKYLWLVEHLDDFVAEGKVLIFTLAKASADLLAYKLKQFFQKRELDIGIDTLHGDKDQQERNQVMQRYKKPLNHESETRILIATDIAARGLDVQDIRTVINYEIPKTLETYIHRIGRTGRMGVNGITPGVAYTLLQNTESSFAVDLVHYLTLSKQVISAELTQIASKDPKYGRLKHHGGGNSARSFGAGGRGGLGSDNANQAMTSQMMANETKQTSTIQTSNSALYGGFVKSSSSEQTSASQLVEVSSSNMEQRRSRFGAADDKPVLIKGFVRASTTESSTLASVTTSVTSSSHPSSEINNSDISIPARKKSRWDS